MSSVSLHQRWPYAINVGMAETIKHIRNLLLLGLTGLCFDMVEA